MWNDFLEFFGPIIVAMVAVVGLAFGVCWFLGLIGRGVMRLQNPPEKVAAAARAFQARLEKPDWTFYEGHLKRPVPESLKRLYSNHRFIAAENLDYNDEHSVVLCALDSKGRDDYQSWSGSDVVPIGNSHDNFIYLKSGEREPNTVYITYHDGGDTEILASDIGIFVEQLFTANKPQA